MSYLAKEYAELEVGGRSFEITEVDGREAVCQLFDFRVTITSDAGGPRAADLIAADAKLLVRDGWGGERTISGIVADYHSAQHDDGTRRLVLCVRPHAHLLTHGSSCRVFQDATVVDVVSGVLGALPHSWELSSSYPRYPYVAQYREADWRFISRWLEREGIYYWFDHSRGSLLVFGDASTDAPALDGGGEVVFRPDARRHSDRPGLHELGSRSRVVPTAFSLGSYNPGRPMTQIAGGTGSGLLEIYDAPGGGPQTSEECNRQSTMLSQRAGVDAVELLGKSFCARLTPGCTMTTLDHPIERFNRTAYITASHLRVVQRRRNTAHDDTPSVLCAFVAIDGDTPYRPARTTPKPRQAGLQSSVVVGAAGAEIQPNASGQVRVQHHWDRDGSRDDRSGKWMRVAQRGAANTLQLPRVGWNVMTFNDEGDVDAPSVLSRVQDAEHMPPYPLPGNKTRVVWKTHTSPGGGSYNEIYFEDTKDAEEMFMNASKDMVLLTKNVRSDFVGHDQTTDVGVNHDLVIDWSDYLDVYGNYTRQVGANEKVTVGGQHSRNIQGNETITIGGDRKLKIARSRGLGVDKNRDLTVGSALIDVSLGTATTEATDAFTTIGAVQAKLSLSSMNDECGAVGIQTIGAAKIEFAGTDRMLDVGNIYLETVGGLMFCRTGASYTDGATNTSNWLVGGLMTSTAPELMVEAEETITLVCGSSTVTITPKTIEFTADQINLSESKIVDTDTAQVERN